MVRFPRFCLATLKEFISIACYIFETWVLNLKNLLGGGRPGRIVILQESNIKKHIYVSTYLISAYLNGLL